MENTTSPHKRL
jgi:hypothetical protein